MDEEAKKVLWRQVVGDRFIVPGVGSDAVYRPRVHFDQSEKDCDQENVQLPEFIFSTVKSVELGFWKGSGYPFVEFLLGPREGLHRTYAFEDGQNREGFVIFEKDFSFSDERGTCQFKIKDAKSFFPSEATNIVLVFADGSKAQFNINNLKVSGGLKAFAAEKGMAVGDTFVFLKRTEGKDVYLGLKRALPHKVAGKDILDAVKEAMKGSYYTVTVFPHDDHLTCVNMG